MTTLDPGPHVSAIIGLAEEIAGFRQNAPRRPSKIIEFARELGDVQPDPASIQEATRAKCWTMGLGYAPGPLPPP